MLWLDVAAESVFLTERWVGHCQKPNHRLVKSCAQRCPAVAVLRDAAAWQPQRTVAHKQTLCLLCRWDPDDPVSRPVPLNVCVTRQEAVCHAGQQVHSAAGPPECTMQHNKQPRTVTAEAAGRADNVNTQQRRWPSLHALCCGCFTSCARPKPTFASRVRACVLQEVAVATLNFTDRASAELHGKLALSALPEWLSIRRRE